MNGEVVDPTGRDAALEGYLGTLLAPEEPAASGSEQEPAASGISRHDGPDSRPAPVERPEESEPADRDDLRQYVAFQLADENYAIEIDAVQEVLRVGEIAPVPGTGAHVVGIMNLRGDIVPVIDGRARFGKPPAALDERARVLVLPGAAGICGMQVDCVADVIDVAAQDTQPLAADSRGYVSPVSGVALRGAGFVALVDPAALLERERPEGATDGNR